MSVPSAEAQIVFLQQIQRLFSEGDFSATYKFALLLALAELAVEVGDDSGNALDLPMRQVGEKFAELYWRQVTPYSSGLPNTNSDILHQNYGAQAAIITPLKHLYRETGGQWSKARNHAQWDESMRAVTATVRNMPLKYLQNFGSKTEPFLYDYPCPPGLVRLKPGVAFHLRRYQGLIQELARSGWIQHIRSNSRNQPILGQVDDLESFMFGSSRTSLASVSAVLLPIQDHRCFYCNERLRSDGEVDHFIPWARYPRDTAHNFVVAHRSCNNDKRAMLAAKRHLDQWLNRFEHFGAEIAGQLAEQGFVSDQNASVRVARWAYEQGIQVGGQGWVRKGETEMLDLSYLTLF